LNVYYAIIDLKIIKKKVSLNLIKQNNIINLNKFHHLLFFIKLDIQMKNK